jgi:hypothetical protein
VDGVLAVNLYAENAAHGRCVDRIREAFGERIVVVEADGSENEVVFAGKAASFPPAFGDLVERLRALEASHPVGLDATMRKILRYREPRETRPRRTGRSRARSRS